ncbi:MAG: hypothetical protein ABR936_17130 [Bacteroidota bacterium]
MNKQALIFVVISILLFVLIQDDHWLIGWDLLDLIFLTALLIGIDRKWGANYFSGLFIVSLFNRETALFIPLWMFLDAYSKKNRKMIAYSALLAMIGIVVICLLRENLFLGSSQVFEGKQIGMDTTHPIGNYYWLGKNIASPFNTYPPWKPGLDLIPAIVIGTIGYFAFQWKSLNATNRNIVILMVAMAATIFTIAVIHESRQWLILMPFIIYLIRNENTSTQTD